MSARLGRLVEIALRDVLDPEMGRSVVDLGLIYEIAAAPDGKVAITMTTTTRGCPLAGFLRKPWPPPPGPSKASQPSR